MWSEALRYVAFAEKFGWTPDQVDELRLPLADRLLPVLGVIEKVRAENEEEEIKKSQRSR